MARSTWERRDRPLLEAIADADDHGGAITHSRDLESLTGLSARDVEAGLRALHRDQYIDAVNATTHDGFAYLEIRLTGDGRREVGQRPTHDAFDAFIAQVDARIAAATDPIERSRLERLREAGVAVGIEALGGIVAGLVTGRLA